MKVTLPWSASSENTSITPTNSIKLPYLASTNKDTDMTIEEIIMRLETAAEDKDWDAVELLLEDLRISEDDWGTISWDEE
jgi:hypothetical protein